MSKLSNVAAVAARLGAVRFARTWRRTRRQSGRGLVLMYHRVSSEPDYLGMTIPPALFAEQLRLLELRARVVPLAELVARLARQAPLEEDLAAITFDDGYRDNLEHALPILQSFGLPATIFVSTGFLDGTSWPAGERLREACEALWGHGISPRAWEGEGTLDDRVRAVLGHPRSFAILARLRRALKAKAAAGESMLDRLEALAGTNRRRKGLMLDWDDVRALAAAGIEIGSHAVSHRILSSVTSSEAEEELSVSKKRLEEEVGRFVDGFAFPNGRAGDFLPEHREMLRRTGYAYACTGETGANLPGCDPYRLVRIGVGQDSAALLDLKLVIGRAA